MRFDAPWPRQGISRYHGSVTGAKRKNPNRAGTDARKRKDGRYETRATLDTPTGRKRVSFYGDTAEEANNKLFQALADQAKGILFSDPGRLTVGEYLQSWLSDTARYQVSEGTLSRYERTCRVHLVPFFGRLRLRDLTAAHVRVFRARKIEEGLNPNTVGVMQGVLSVALNQAVDDGLIPANSASRVKKASHPRGAADAVTLLPGGVPPDRGSPGHP
jgi:integrase